MSSSSPSGGGAPLPADPLAVPPRWRRPRRGFTLLEVVIVAAIFAVALVPVAMAITSANRLGFSADRLLDATLQAQTVLEALVELEPREFPPQVAASPAGFLLLSDGSPPPAGTGGRFDEVAAWFSIPPPPEMTRRVHATGTAEGHVVVRVEVSWLRLAGKARTEHSLTLAGVSVPRGGR